MKTGRIYVISDAHFGSGTADKEQEKLERFRSFIQYIQSRAETLYILGDLFDFWFEYRSVIFEKHFPVLHALASLVESGVRVRYIAGNHDFWFGPFLPSRTGITASLYPVETVHQGISLFMAHGDGLIAKDRGYRMLRRILRFPLNRWLFSQIHPDWGTALADTVSRLSRRYLSKEKRFDFTAEYRAFAARQHARGVSAVILGHSHQPMMEKMENGLLLNAGNWIDDFSYLVLENGVFSLRYWS